jgi:hypothetical protein
VVMWIVRGRLLRNSAAVRESHLTHGPIFNNFRPTEVVPFPFVVLAGVR